MIVRGFDASSVQWNLPAQALADAGYKFAYLKCQEGNKAKDPTFENHRVQLKAVGILVGQYIFPYPLPHLDPVAQAELFYAASDCGAHAGELPPAFDFEWPAPELWAHWKCDAKQMALWAKACLARMTELWGQRPLVYTYPWFMQALLRGGADLSFLADYPLWMADYKYAGKEIVDGQSPVLPSPWTRWTFWQHDGDKGLKMPGGGDADFNVFNGSEDDLQKLAGVVTPCGEGPILHVDTELYDALRELATQRDGS